MNKEEIIQKLNEINEKLKTDEPFPIYLDINNKLQIDNDISKDDKLKIVQLVNEYWNNNQLNMINQLEKEKTELEEILFEVLSKQLIV